MNFLVVCASILIIWSLIGQRKILSASFANLLGTLLFIVLGFQLEPDLDRWVVIPIGIGFYLFLALGEYCGRHVPVDTQRYRRFGQMLISNPITNHSLTIFFVLFCFLPLFQVLASGQSISETFASVWSTNTAPMTSRNLVEMSGQSLSGQEALIRGVQTQLSGFWYLSLGILMVNKRKLLFPLFGIYIIGSFLTSGGFRSLLMVSLLLPVLLIWMSSEEQRPKWAINPKPKKANRLFTIILIGVITVGLLVFLDWLRYGRQGRLSEGTVLDRLERTLRTDFAYGGQGLLFGINNMPDSPDRGLSYVERTIVLPIPRFLWPGKPTSNPNQEYTELVTGRSYQEYGSILLFTPLGEALFNFGYLGVILIPFIYGLLVALLEKIYSSSIAYRGLLVQTYIWAFLAMRLTFFNLFSTLIITNFILLLMLIVGARLISKRNIIRPKVIKHAAN